MKNSLMNFITDERGTTVTHVLPAFAGAGLAVAVMTNEHQLVGLPMAIGTLKWEWNCKGKMMFTNRDIARDRHLFIPPREENVEKKEIEAPIDLHDGSKINQPGLAWKWPGDGRVFLIPLELAERAGLLGLTRDVVAYLTKCYVIEQRRTGNDEIEFTMREMANALGMAWRGRDTIEALSKALDLGRALTVRNMPIRTKIRVPTNRDRTRFKEEIVIKKVTFGFLDGWGRTVMRGGKPIPVNKQPCSAFLSRYYQHMLDKFPVAPVPAAAIEAANNAPPRIRGAVKNLAYHLAARVPVPEGKVRLLLSTLQEICHFNNDPRRQGEIRRAVENVFKVLHPVLIRNYEYGKLGYDIILAGSLKKDKEKPPGT